MNTYNGITCFTIVDQNGNLVGNQDLTLLPDAVRNATTSSADQVNVNGRGVVITLNITAASGTGGLKVLLQGRDIASGNYYTFATLAGTAIVATGLYDYVCYPGTTGGYTNNYGAPVPRTWRVQIQHGDATNYEYSVGASVIV